SRMLPLSFDGPAPAPGVELLAGALRARHITSTAGGRALALVPLHPIGGAARTADGRPCEGIRPAWVPGLRREHASPSRGGWPSTATAGGGPVGVSAVASDIPTAIVAARRSRPPHEGEGSRARATTLPTGANLGRSGLEAFGGTR